MPTHPECIKVPFGYIDGFEIGDFRRAAVYAWMEAATGHGLTVRNQTGILEYAYKHNYIMIIAGNGEEREELDWIDAGLVAVDGYVCLVRWVEGEVVAFPIDCYNGGRPTPDTWVIPDKLVPDEPTPEPVRLPSEPDPVYMALSEITQRVGEVTAAEVLLAQALRSAGAVPFGELVDALGVKSFTDALAYMTWLEQLLQSQTPMGDKT